MGVGGPAPCSQHCCERMRLGFELRHRFLSPNPLSQASLLPWGGRARPKVSSVEENAAVQGTQEDISFLQPELGARGARPGPSEPPRPLKCLSSQLPPRPWRWPGSWASVGATSLPPCSSEWPAWRAVGGPTHRVLPLGRGPLCPTCSLSVPTYAPPRSVLPGSAYFI